EARTDAPGPLHAAQRLEERTRIALARIDDAAVQQRQDARVERSGIEAALRRRKRFLVVSVLDQRKALRRQRRVALPVQRLRARRDADDARGVAHHVTLHVLE